MLSRSGGLHLLLRRPVKCWRVVLGMPLVHWQRPREPFPYVQGWRRRAEFLTALPACRWMVEAAQFALRGACVFWGWVTLVTLGTHGHFRRRADVSSVSDIPTQRAALDRSAVRSAAGMKSMRTNVKRHMRSFKRHHSGGGLSEHSGLHYPGS